MAQLGEYSDYMTNVLGNSTSYLTFVYGSIVMSLCISKGRVVDTVRLLRMSFFLQLRFQLLLMLLGRWSRQQPQDLHQCIRA